MEQRRTEESPVGPIRLERDAPRPATILKVATELEERGAEIRELFKEIRAPGGRWRCRYTWCAAGGTSSSKSRQVPGSSE